MSGVEPIPHPAELSLWVIPWDSLDFESSYPMLHLAIESGLSIALPLLSFIELDIHFARHSLYGLETHLPNCPCIILIRHTSWQTNCSPLTLESADIRHETNNVNAENLWQILVLLLHINLPIFGLIGLYDCWFLKRTWLSPGLVLTRWTATGRQPVRFCQRQHRMGRYLHLAVNLLIVWCEAGYTALSNSLAECFQTHQTLSLSHLLL